MNAREQGFLLLTSHLGDPQRKVLTAPQLRNLFLRVRSSAAPSADRELSKQDLLNLGYDREMAVRILDLLSGEEQLQWYLKQGSKLGCVPTTRISLQYPQSLKEKLGLDCPGSLWAKGNLELLQKPAISLVGSRELRQENALFAAEVGRQAARQGYILVSGNARGADQVAQNACLEAGGSVISIVADRLCQHKAEDSVLYISEDGFDIPFSSLRALSRNRLIHAMGAITMVAQCNFEKGGTWDGTRNNLKNGYSPVYCFQDGSRGINGLIDRGAMEISIAQLKDFSALQPQQTCFL